MTENFDDPLRRRPLIDDMTGEVVSDPDGEPITELEGHDALDLMYAMTIEERAAGERAWRYGHVIVDEAQELTPMQWRMVARRARGHSMTIVGDLAQRTAGAPAGWDELLPADIGTPRRFDLATNYRSTDELARLSVPVLRDIAPGLDPPVAIRSGPDPVVVEVADIARALPEVLEEARAAVDEGTVAAIGAPGRAGTITAIEAKGMEFDATVIVEPAEIAAQPGGSGQLYVALTRATEWCWIVHSQPLPIELVSSVP